MTALRLVADDLTGALDAAAPFARADAPVAVLRDAARAGACGGAWALDAATRDADAERAAAAARNAGALLREGAPAFRKIDSQLRGHVAAEIAATASRGGFASVVIAPAFPAQGRVTRGGRQYAHDGAEQWQPVGSDLASELMPLGLKLQPAATAAAMTGRGAFLCDAESDADLAAIVAAGRALAPPVLWCGSAGLARALAGRMPPQCALPAGPVLALIGSRHRIAVAEVDRLVDRQPDVVRAIADPAAIAVAVAYAGRRLRAGQSAVLALRLPALAPAEASEVLRRLAQASAALSPASLFASGGDTLAALFDAVGAERLDCLGEIAPGVPLSRIAGGCWNGVAVVSKSGGFAAGDVLASLFDHEMEKKRVQA